MGPAEPPSTTLPNVLVIGDSVSIGYVGVVANELKDVAKVQHGPWDVSDGGAGDTANGVACLDRYLVTQTQASVKWDLITFNFGLHNLDNSSRCESLYHDQLLNITTRLAALKTKMLYITTTPYMPLRTIGNMAVEDMNSIAGKMATENKIPILDLYSSVTDVCGKVYTDCKICRKTPCSYHYNNDGETMQGKIIAQSIRQMLTPATVV